MDFSPSTTARGVSGNGQTLAKQNERICRIHVASRLNVNRHKYADQQALAAIGAWRRRV